ncbi:Protoporphyrinogen oxidase [Hypoxylon crocopeplum]|nr:Protoporphyrinogen oxidase [Hypoxylon crocopeplum]
MTPKHLEDAFISLLRSAYRNAQHGHRLGISRSPTSRQLSSLAAKRIVPNPLLAAQLTRSRTEKLPRARSQAFATAGAGNIKAREIAVLGGGMTGLTAAHYLARHARDANITLYEGSDRLGGWVYGSMVQVGDGENDKVLFQHGARMLRSGSTTLDYDDFVFFDVLSNLGIGTKLGQPPASSGGRYLYYPDHLVKLPSGLNLEAAASILSEPLWDGLVKSVWNSWKMPGLWSPLSMPRGEFEHTLNEDESVAEFFGRMFRDDRLVKNVISGMAHGIYGGDVHNLSVKHTVFANLWRRTKLPAVPRHSWIETKHIRLLRDILDGPNRFEVIRLGQENLKVNMMKFDDGLLTLVDGLTRDLNSQSNVTVKTDSRVTSLAHEGNRVSVTTANGKKQYDQVICTLFSKHLAELVEPKGLLPRLAETHAVTIMVVNLWFPNPKILARNPGFGYLVPTSTPGNDEWVLGVLFDSDCEIRDEPAGTKLTVMLGGHYWDGWTQYPAEGMAVNMAFQAVQRHLGIDPAEEVFASACLCRDCIPQHFVGHRERMEISHYDLLAAFQGRLSVAGPSYTAVGVKPSMRAGFDVAMRVATGRGPPWFRRPDAEDSFFAFSPASGDDNPDHVGSTGLKGFTENENLGNECISDNEFPFKRWATYPSDSAKSKDGRGRE